jgi:hypothetical protein
MNHGRNTGFTNQQAGRLLLAAANTLLCRRFVEPAGNAGVAGSILSAPQTENAEGPRGTASGRQKGGRDATDRRRT